MAIHLRHPRAATLLLFFASVWFCALGCSGRIVLVSPYDEVIDTGLQEYKENLNLFVKRTGDRSGKTEGTFAASSDAYAELEVKIQMLIDRAQLQQQREVGCKLDDETWSRIKRSFADAASLPTPNPNAGSAHGCIYMMLTNVQKQLGDVKNIHKDPQQCASPDPSVPTCIRPAAVASIVKISNQTIDAALLIEATQKKYEEEKRQ
jgi:hypothetical protein